MSNLQELEDFNWLEKRDPSPAWAPGLPHTLNDVINTRRSESESERSLRVIRGLGSACFACSICNLGQNLANQNGLCRDPHIFGSTDYSKFVIVCSNPHWDDLQWRTPLSGTCGRIFDMHLSQNGLTRDMFYITTLVKCRTPDDALPEQASVDACEPYFGLEIRALQPLLLVTLGAHSFSQICPGVEYNNGLQKITNSKYGIKTFAIYDPGQLLVDGSLEDKFSQQIKLLGGLVKRLS